MSFGSLCHLLFYNLTSPARHENRRLGMLRRILIGILVLTVCACALGQARAQPLPDDDAGEVLQGRIVRLPPVDDEAGDTVEWPKPDDGNSAYVAEILSRLDAAEAELARLRGDADAQTRATLTAFQEQGAYPREQGQAVSPGKPLTDKFPTFRVTGFTQFDGGWYSQSPLNRATVGNAQDGVGFRRARVGVTGKMTEFTNYMVEMDFATAGRPSFFDVWGEQENIPWLGTVRGGQYVQPFSVDAMSGFRHLVFLERSLPFLAFVPFRRVGIEAYNWSEDERLNWAYSVFKTGGFNNAPLGDDRYATDIGDVGGYSFSGRMTYLVQYDPEANDRYLWHIGGAYDYSQLTANTAAGSTSPVPFYQAKTTPEFGPLGSPETPQPFGQAFAATPVFVDTGKYRASNFSMYGLETVYQAGATSIQAEWMGTVVESPVGPIFYHGAYAQIAYRLTGEHRVYYKKMGAFGNPVPFTNFIALKPGGIVGWGAWEVAFRWSYVDLRNPANLTPFYLSGTNAAGNGLLNDSTVGMSWFMNENLKMQFNWIHAMLDNTAKGFSTADLFVTRMQVSF